ncbi:methionine ABC transporter ATP-binding protein [Neomicrococcus aestuarii]|uniref:methionine ABC transporter ATP-binding protein n=1 Tax=Neomicrococcus aestuarii TaxID=556325 RepID=UPI000A6B7DAD|nr:methionine ABC transporter ATP-binding protein [Neomicrococcus aestuarii]
MTAIVEFRNVSKTFPGTKNSDPVKAVQDVTLDIEAGSITGIIGYSGAGKSTLVRLINALELPDTGDLRVDGADLTRMKERELRTLRSSIGMIFQQFNLLNSRSVAKNIEYPLIVAGVKAEERAKRVTELLRFVGIESKRNQFPSQLSGGQKQRVGIARALATNPKILLADEATSALDPETTAEVLDLLKRVNTEFGTTIVVITHEMHVVRSICSNVAVMEHGKVLEYGPVYDVFAFAKEEATQRFINSTIQDRPSPETVARLQSLHPGTFVTVSIVESAVPDRSEYDDAGSSSGAPASSGVADLLSQASSVRKTVVFGSITEIAQRPYGSLTYVFDGPEADVQQLIENLKRITATQVWEDQRSILKGDAS